MKSVAEMLDDKQKKAEQGPWFPASGGTETPFISRSGVKLWYMYQPSTGRHQYLRCDSDMFITNEEAWMLMGNR